MPRQAQQSASDGATKPGSLSVDEAIVRVQHARKNIAAAEALNGADAKSAASTSEQDSDGLDPDVTNPGDGESDAGGSVDDDANAAPEGGADGEGDASKDPTYTLVGEDGEEVEVSWADLVDAYWKAASLHGDYTNKTKALAEQRRAVEQQAKEQESRAANLTAREQEVDRAKTQYDTALTALQGVYDERATKFAGIDWRQLRQNDPEKYEELRLEHDLHKEDQEKLDAERQRRETERAQETDARRKQVLEQFRTGVVQAFPQWVDQEVMTKDWGAMHKTATDLGFNDTEIKSTIDVRVLKMLHKAAQFDRIKAAKQSATSQAPNRVTARETAREPAPVIRPSGARPVVRAGKGGQIGVRDAMEAFRAATKSGGSNVNALDAAANLLAARRASARPTGRTAPRR